MNVLLLGLSHKTAPVEVREQLAFDESASGSLASALTERPGISEAMVLSTCNRVEFLVQSNSDYNAADAVQAFLNGKSTIAETTPFFYRYLNRDAVSHLFRVASSLD